MVTGMLKIVFIFFIIFGIIFLSIFISVITTILSPKRRHKWMRDEMNFLKEELLNTRGDIEDMFKDITGNKYEKSTFKSNHKYCMWCGAEMTDDFIYCKNCGKKQK